MENNRIIANVFFNSQYQKINIFFPQKTNEIIKNFLLDNNWKFNKKNKTFFPNTLEAGINSKLFLTDFVNTFNIVCNDFSKIQLPDYNYELSEKEIYEIQNRIDNKQNLFIELQDILKSGVSIQKINPNANVGNIEFRRGEFKHNGVLHISLRRFNERTNENHQFPRKNTISTISTNEIHNALLETTALLFLISDSLSSYEALPTDGRNWYIHGNGLEITVRKDKYSKFVVTGYSNDLFSDKTNTEAAETINAVIAKYGYTQEFLDLYTLVGAELASIYPNIALQIKSVNLYYKKHNKYIPDISINQLNEPIITKNNILISKNISSFQNNNTDILEIIGNLIDTDKTGKLTLESYKTLAQAMNIYSDKRYETARYLFVKDGQIIRHLTVSTQTPSSTIIKPDDSFLYNLKNYAEQTDSKIVFLHNHPSGFVMPSDADIELTDYMTNFFKKSDGSNYFTGHIILDHGNYGLYTSDTKTWGALIDRQLKPLDELYKTYSLEYGRHKIRASFDDTTRKITEKSLLELSDYARKCDGGNMWNKKNWVCAVLINNQGIVTSLEHINIHELQNHKVLSDKLKSLGRSYGSENVVLLPYTSEQFLLCESFAQKTGKVKEVFHQKTDGTFETSSYSNGNIFNDLKKDDIVIEDTENNKEAVFNKLIKNRKSDKDSAIRTPPSYKQVFNKAAEPLSNNKIAAPVVPENYFFRTTGSISSMQKSLPVDFNIPFEMTPFDYVSAIYIKNSPFVKIWNQSVIIPLSNKFQKQNYEIENVLNDSFKNLDKVFYLNKNKTIDNFSIIKEPEYSSEINNNLHSQNVIKNINSFEKEDKTMIKNLYLNTSVDEINWTTDENGNRTFTDAKGNSFSDKELDNPLNNRFDFDSSSNDYIRSQKYFNFNGNNYEYEFVSAGKDPKKQTIELFVSIPGKDGVKQSLFYSSYQTDYFDNLQNEDIVKEIGKEFNKNAVYITHQLSGEMLFNDFNYRLQRNSLPDREHLYEDFVDCYNSTLTAYYTSGQQEEIKKYVLEKTMKYSVKSYEECIPFYKEVLEQNPVETGQEVFAGIKENNIRKYGLVESEEEANRIKELHGAELHIDVMHQLIEAKKYYDNNKDGTWKDFGELVYCRTAVGRYTSWQQSEIERYFMDYFDAKNHDEVLQRLENFLDTEIAIENGAAWELDDFGNRVLKDTSGYTPEMKQTAMENFRKDNESMVISEETLEKLKKANEQPFESQENVVNNNTKTSSGEQVLEEEPPMEMNYSVPDEEKLENPMDISSETETSSEYNQSSAENKENEQPVPVTREEFEQLQNNLQAMLEKIQQLEEENELLRKKNQALSDPTKIQQPNNSASDSMTAGRTTSSSGAEQPVEHLVNQDGFGLETAFTPNQIVPKFGIGEEPDIILYDKARFKRIERDENNELNNKVVLSVLMPNGDDKEIEIPEQRYMKIIKASEEYEAGKLRYSENSDLWKKNLIDYKLKMLTDVDSYRLNTPENFMHNFRIHCKHQANNAQEAMSIAALMVEKMHPADRATFNRMVDNVNSNSGENFYQNLLMKEYDKIAQQKGISEQNLPKSFEFSGDNVLFLDMDKDNIEIKYGETIGNTHTKVGDSIPMSFTMKDFRGKKYKTPKSDWKIAKVSKNMNPDMAIIYNEETKSTMRIKLSTLTEHIQKIEKIQAKEAKKQIKKENKKYGYEGHEL